MGIGETEWKTRSERYNMPINDQSEDMHWKLKWMKNDFNKEGNEGNEYFVDRLRK